MPSVDVELRALRILIADDQRMFAESLMAVLCADESVDVVGIAGNGRQAVELAVALQPDVILMDLKMPLMDGLEATKQIRAANIDSQILILTGTDAPVGSDDATRAGASGYLRKENGIDELRRVFLEAALLAAVLGARSP